MASVVGICGSLLLVWTHDEVSERHPNGTEHFGCVIDVSRMLRYPEMRLDYLRAQQHWRNPQEDMDARGLLDATRLVV